MLKQVIVLWNYCIQSTLKLQENVTFFNEFYLCGTFPISLPPEELLNIEEYSQICSPLQN